MHSAEAGLLEGLRRGDESARAEFYRAHFRRVYLWCRHMGGGRVDPEDAAAEVFIVVFTKAAGFRGEAQLSTWLYRIARKVVASQRRRAWLGRLVGIDAYAGALRGASNPETEAGARLTIEQARRVLDTLGDRKREAFVLVDLCGYTLEEAAEIAGVSAATVGSRVFYARKEFMERYARATGEVAHDQ